jgi:rRNA maturation endonuclease Nob1
MNEVVKVPDRKRAILHQRRLEGNVRVDAANHESVERVAHAVDRLVAGAPWQISLAIIES